MLAEIYHIRNNWKDNQIIKLNEKSDLFSFNTMTSLGVKKYIHLYHPFNGYIVFYWVNVP